MVPPAEDQDPILNMEKLSASIAKLSVAVLNLTSDLEKVTKLEKDSTKTAEQSLKQNEKILDFEQDSTEALKNFKDEPEKVGSKFGLLSGNIGLLASMGESAAMSMEGLAENSIITGKELNFFAQNRRRETIATIKSFVSLRKAIMLSASFLTGVFTSAMKSTVGVIGQIGLAGIRRGVGPQAVAGRPEGRAAPQQVGTKFQGIPDWMLPFGLKGKGPSAAKPGTSDIGEALKDFTEIGIPFKQAADSLTAMFEAGLNKNVKGLLDLTKKSTMLGYDIKRLGEQTRQLALTTGMGNEAAVALMDSILTSTREYNVEAERLVKAMERLAGVQATAATLGGTKVVDAFTKGTALLAGKLGQGGQEMAATLMAQLNIANKDAFLVSAKFGQDMEKMLGGGTGMEVAEGVENLSRQIVGMMNSMGGGEDVTYSDPIMLQLMESLTGISAENLNTLRVLTENNRALLEMTAEEREKADSDMIQQRLMTDLQTQLNSLMDGVFDWFLKTMYPILQTTYDFIKNNGTTVTNYLTALLERTKIALKWLANIAQLLMMIKVVSIATKVSLTIMTLFARATKKAEFLYTARTQNLQTQMLYQLMGPQQRKLLSIERATWLQAKKPGGGGIVGLIVNVIVLLAVGAAALWATKKAVDNSTAAFKISKADQKTLDGLTAEMEKSEEVLQKISDNAAQINNKISPDRTNDLTNMLASRQIIQEELTREMIEILEERNEDLRAGASSYRGTRGMGPTAAGAY